MKIGFVTLLMIGMAMGQTPICRDGNTILYGDNSLVGPVDESKDSFKKLPECAEPHWRPGAKPKPAKSPANKAAPITELIGASKCKIVPAGDGCNACTVCDGPNSASMCTTMYCTQKGEIEKLLKSPPETPPNAKPLDVPAIRKTVKDEPEPTYPRDMDSISMCYQWDNNLKRCMVGSIDQEGIAAKRQEWAILHAHWLERKKHATVEWTCPDPDAYSLQISMSGKRANCHRIVP